MVQRDLVQEQLLLVDFLLHDLLHHDLVPFVVVVPVETLVVLLEDTERTVQNSMLCFILLMVLKLFDVLIVCTLHVLFKNLETRLILHHEEGFLDGAI